jgi:23S rRNA (guanosine2251-2'-O)-methyltransferase
MENNKPSIIEGRIPVLEALRAGRPVNRIMLDKNAKAQGTIAEIERLARQQGVPVDHVDSQILNRENPGGASQGVIAYAAAKEYVGLDDILAIPLGKNEPAFFCVLDGVEDPQNLGAIIRTAEAAGVHGIIIRSRRAVGITPAVAKASAGAVEYVPVARVANIAQAIETLKKNNVWVVGIDMSGEAEYTRVNLRLPTAIVIGGEGQGLSALVKKRCDVSAFIPMQGKITSLNASVAAAVVMYEVLRQRRQAA